ncbi:MAG: type II toxin-antitoxin system RelE/ParE family toxin [Pseudomonadota bacterium]
MFGMIVTVRDRRVFEILDGKRPKRFPPDVFRAAERRLKALDLAGRLEDLTVPPSMRLEALRGDRAGQHSIRINRQWRICFRWTE